MQAERRARNQQAAKALALARVVQLEAKIVPTLPSSTRTAIGTVTTIVFAEKVLIVESATGKQLAFTLASDATAKAICGRDEENVRVADIKPPVVALVVYDRKSPQEFPGRQTVKMIVTSSCPDA